MGTGSRSVGHCDVADRGEGGLHTVAESHRSDHTLLPSTAFWAQGRGSRTADKTIPTLARRSRPLGRWILGTRVQPLATAGTNESTLRASRLSLATGAGHTANRVPEVGEIPHQRRRDLVLRGLGPAPRCVVCTRGVDRHRNPRRTTPGNADGGDVDSDRLLTSRPSRSRRTCSCRSARAGGEGSRRRSCRRRSGRAGRSLGGVERRRPRGCGRRHRR